MECAGILFLETFTKFLESCSLTFLCFDALWKGLSNIGVLPQPIYCILTGMIHCCVLSSGVAHGSITYTLPL